MIGLAVKLLKVQPVMSGTWQDFSGMGESVTNTTYFF